VLGDLIYEAKGKITGYRVLGVENPKIEVTITQNGTLKGGIEATDTVTYWSIPTDNKRLLKLALVSITESIRNNPGKFNFLFDSVSYSSTITSIEYGSSQYHYGPYPYAYKQYPSHDQYTKVYADMLLDEAEKLYSKMVKDFTNKTINDPAILSQSSSSSLSLLPRSDNDEEKKQIRSHVFQRSTGDTNKTYLYREEHTFIQSEFDDDGV
jgi:hypothetical protein